MLVIQRRNCIVIDDRQGTTRAEIAHSSSGWHTTTDRACQGKSKETTPPRDREVHSGRRRVPDAANPQLYMGAVFAPIEPAKWGIRSRYVTGATVGRLRLLLDGPLSPLQIGIPYCAVQINGRLLNALVQLQVL